MPGGRFAPTKKHGAESGVIYPAGPFDKDGIKALSALFKDAGRDFLMAIGMGVIVAYMIPVVWLSVKQTSFPIPQLVYGYQLEKVTAKEKQLREDPKEKEVIAAFKALADSYDAKLKDVPAALAADKAAAEKKLADLKAANAPLAEVQAAEKALTSLPASEADAKKAWTAAKAANAARAAPLGGMPAHAAIFAGDPNGDEKAKAAYDTSRRNFLALVFCLMVGTAALPHILMRYYTTPSVREARISVFWSLFFIFLLYFTAPAYAAFAKLEVYQDVIGPVAAGPAVSNRNRRTRPAAVETPRERAFSSRHRTGFAYSSTRMFRFAQISLRIFGHTVTLTSPRCAVRSKAMYVRDCPMPPPMLSGTSSFTIAW